MSIKGADKEDLALASFDGWIPEDTQGKAFCKDNVS